MSKSQYLSAISVIMTWPLAELSDEHIRIVETDDQSTSSKLLLLYGCRGGSPTCPEPSSEQNTWCGQVEITWSLLSPEQPGRATSFHGVC